MAILGYSDKVLSSPSWPSVLQGHGAPGIAPDFVGQRYLDLDTDTFYDAAGLTSADWIESGSGGGGGTGDVVGPSSATSDHFASYNGTTGKLIKDSGVGAADFATAAQGTDVRTPTIHNNTKHSEAYIVQAAAVVPNSAITGATKTKITYDAKGLVTGGADATASDVGALPIGGGTLTGVTTAYPDTTTKHGGIRNVFLSTEAATAGSNIDLMADGDLWIQHSA